MSKSKCLACAVLALLFAVPVLAQQSATKAAGQPAAGGDAASARATVATSGMALVSADRILNRNVYNQNNQDIGDLERLYLDAGAGRVAFVGVQTGGMFGIGGETVAVPWQALRLDQNDRIVLAVTEDKLKSGPRIRTDADQINDRAFRDNVYAFYGLPAPDAGPLTGTTTPGQGAGRLISLDRLINRNVVSQTGESFGDLERVYLNPQTGRAELAVISTGGMLGMGASNMAVPWQAISLNEQGGLVMNVDQAKLRGAPPYDPGRVSEPTFRQRLYEYFGYENR